MKLNIFLFLSALLLFPSCFSYGQPLSQKAESTDDIIVQKNVMIPAPDGVKLATDIYQIANKDLSAEVRLPVLLQRTPYGKGSERFVKVLSQLARMGYVVAIQDIRGRYDSEGIFTKYNPLEASDGAATVEWLSKQSYADGRVGMWGTSYAAHTQADASKLNPHGLGAMVINMGGMTNAWDHAVRQGGAFELGRELTWAFKQIPADIEDSIVKAHFESEKIDDWYHAWPFRKGLSPLSIAPNFEDYILEEATHSDYDDYWKEIGINWEEYYTQTADVPMVHIGGWFDIFLRGTIQNYMVLDSLQDSPKWLIIGPWTHSGNTRTYAGDVDFGEAAAITDFQEGYQGLWFDYILKNKKNDRLPPKPIRIFMMGSGDGSKGKDGRLNHGGYWMDFDSWPPKQMKSTAYFFHEDGRLDPRKPEKETSSTTFTFDPSHPVPTLGGSVSARVKDGAYNQRERPDFVGSSPPYLPTRSRQDVVVFQSDPLQEDLRIAGPIKVELFCSSSAKDTDFTVKLVDVYPPSADFPEGFDMNITDGVVRMSYRNGRHDRDLINPGEIYEVVIEPFATANIFKKGHRIRVDISSSNFPRWDVNPNTGEPLGKHRKMICADNTIFHSEVYPSKIVLPILMQTRSESRINKD